MLTHSGRSSSHLLLQGRPYTPPPERPSFEGVSSSITTASSGPSLVERKAVSVTADIPPRLAQAMVEIVVVGSPGVSSAPEGAFFANLQPVSEEADELEPGAPDPRAAFVGSRVNDREQPGSAVTWHPFRAPAAPMADRHDRKDQKAQARAFQGAGAGAEPVVPQPPAPPLVQPLEVAAPGVMAGAVAGGLVPRQSTCDKLAIGLRVGMGNVGREAVAGGLRVATHLSVVRALKDAFVTDRLSAEKAIPGFFGVTAGVLGSAFLGAGALTRLAGGADRDALARCYAIGMVLASGLVPAIAMSATTSGAGFALQVHLAGRLAGALATETLMQLTDGVTARARLVAPPVNPLEPEPPGSLRSSLLRRPLTSLVAYAELGTLAEFVAGPPLARVVEGMGLSAQVAQAVVRVVPEMCFALWDSIAMAAAASSDNLDLVLEPGQLSALAGNLRRFCETFSRIRELTGVRVLASSPLDFVGIGAAMHPGSLAMELTGMFVRHLSRIRGYLQQESRTPAGTLDGAAQDFLAAHDAFLGSSGAGLDIRRHAGAFGEPDDLV